MTIAAGVELPEAGIVGICRRHQVRVREVMLTATAVGELPEVAARLGLERGAVVVHDTRTRAVAGAEVVKAFGSRAGGCIEVLVPDPAGGGPSLPSKPRWR